METFEASGRLDRKVEGLAANDDDPTSPGLEDHLDEAPDPLAFILAPENLRHEQIVWRGRERAICAFEWEGRRIWGATAAILKNLLERLED